MQPITTSKESGLTSYWNFMCHICNDFDMEKMQSNIIVSQTLCVTCSFLILLGSTSFYGVSKPKNDGSLFHIRGATQYAKKVWIFLKILEHWVIGNCMITEKQMIENLYYSILTRCHHNPQLSAWEKQGQVMKSNTSVLKHTNSTCRQ